MESYNFYDTNLNKYTETGLQKIKRNEKKITLLLSWLPFCWDSKTGRIFPCQTDKYIDQIMAKDSKWLAEITDEDCISGKSDYNAKELTKTIEKILRFIGEKPENKEVFMNSILYNAYVLPLVSGAMYDGDAEWTEYKAKDNANPIFNGKSAGDAALIAFVNNSKIPECLKVDEVIKATVTTKENGDVEFEQNNLNLRGAIATATNDFLNVLRNNPIFTDSFEVADTDPPCAE